MEKPLKIIYPSVRTVDNDEHRGMVREIFSTITAKYDFLNHALSLGRDIVWRRETVKCMRFFNTNRFLDVATGTADLAIEAALQNPGIKVTGIDLVREMMAVGKRKLDDGTLSGRINLGQGDALSLPFADASFDVAAIAFGIRNIRDRLKALKEMKRVVTPGGQVIVLEMNFPQNTLFRKIYFLYLNHFLPRAARLFSRNPAAYGYLADSIINFPSPADFARLMKASGLENIRARGLTLGITYLYRGTRPEAQK